MEHASKKHAYYCRRTRHLKSSLHKSFPLMVNGVKSLQDSEEILHHLRPGQIIPPGCILLPGSVDRNGSPLVIIRTKFLVQVAWMAPEDILEAMVYLANYFIEQQPGSIRSSASILLDMQDTSWRVQKMLIAAVATSEGEIPEAIEDGDVLFEAIRMVVSFFMECFPLKWGTIILYKPWWYLKWTNPRAEIANSEEELWTHVSSNNLPIEYGGSLIMDKALFLRNLLVRAQKNGEQVPFAKPNAEEKLAPQKEFHQTTLDISSTNPWSILASAISPNAERCLLSRKFSNCTLVQIKKYISDGQ